MNIEFDEEYINSEMKKSVTKYIMQNNLIRKFIKDAIAEIVDEELSMRNLKRYVHDLFQKQINDILELKIRNLKKKRRKDEKTK